MRRQQQQVSENVAWKRGQQQQQQDMEKTHTGFFGDREGIAKPLIMNNKDYDRTDIWLDNDSSTLKSRLEDKVLTD